jgi:hypothetical protein
MQLYLHVLMSSWWSANKSELPQSFSVYQLWRNRCHGITVITTGDLKRTHSTVATKYPIPHKIYWNGIPTQNNAEWPHIATGRMLGTRFIYIATGKMLGTRFIYIATGRMLGTRFIYIATRIYRDLKYWEGPQHNKQFAHLEHNETEQTNN